MEELPITLHRAKALVIGFGRLGKVLAHRLSALGARVSVSARQYSDLAWIEAYNYGAEHTEELDGWLCGYDVIFNTVPTQVLNESRLDELKEGCVVIDLASKPGGVKQSIGSGRSAPSPLIREAPNPCAQRPAGS